MIPPDNVYGTGHLAEVLRAELALHNVHFGALGFVAQDVTEHSEQQLRKVEGCFTQAGIHHPYVVVLSQVPPGWTRKMANGRAGVFYQVDTIIVKWAVPRMLRPEQFIVGCAYPDVALPVPYQEYLARHDCPVLQMSYESAEMAKCAINYMLAAQLRVVRDLADACERRNANYEDVRRAMHNDARIGPQAYLSPPGFPNQHLSRDVKTIKEIIGSE